MPGVTMVFLLIIHQLMYTYRFIINNFMQPSVRIERKKKLCWISVKTDNYKKTIRTAALCGLFIIRCTVGKTRFYTVFPRGICYGTASKGL